MNASPSRVWADHFLDCPDCILGDTPAEDVLCEEGRPLREAAVEDIRERMKNFVYGER